MKKNPPEEKTLLPQENLPPEEKTPLGPNFFAINSAVEFFFKLFAMKSSVVGLG